MRGPDGSEKFHAAESCSAKLAMQGITNPLVQKTGSGLIAYIQMGKLEQRASN